MTTHTYTTDIAQHRILLMLLAMDTANTGLTAEQIAVRVGLSTGAARRYLNYLHSQKIIYISHWPRSRAIGVRDRAFKIAYGPKRDNPKPRNLTKAEIDTRFHRKRLQDPERHTVYLQKRRARETALPSPDPLITALFTKTS